MHFPVLFHVIVFGMLTGKPWRFLLSDSTVYLLYKYSIIVFARDSMVLTFHFVSSPGLLISIASNVQWKFAFLSLGRPEYLQDGDVVASRFQVRWIHMVFQ